MGRTIQMMECDTGLIAELLKEDKNTFTIILSKDALEKVRDALVEKMARESRIEVGDVVSDYGYHGAVVITQIRGNSFRGYYVVDGATVDNLHFVDEKTGRQIFEKIASGNGQWKLCRGGAYFEPKSTTDRSEGG